MSDTTANDNNQTGATRASDPRTRAAARTLHQTQVALTITVLRLPVDTRDAEDTEAEPALRAVIIGGHNANEGEVLKALDMAGKAVANAVKSILDRMAQALPDEHKVERVPLIVLPGGVRMEP